MGGKHNPNGWSWTSRFFVRQESYQRWSNGHQRLNGWKGLDTTGDDRYTEFDPALSDTARHDLIQVVLLLLMVRS
jgi:hypothetical protein